VQAETCTADTLIKSEDGPIALCSSVRAYSLIDRHAALTLTKPQRAKLLQKQRSQPGHTIPFWLSQAR
jgi:hypothetical protein